MFSRNINGGKVFTVHQKIRGFKKRLFKSKKLHEETGSKRMEPVKVIKKVTENLNCKNMDIHQKKLSKKQLIMKIFDLEIFDFYRLFKVKSHSDRYKRADISKDKKIRKQSTFRRRKSSCFS